MHAEWATAAEVTMHEGRVEARTTQDSDVVSFTQALLKRNAHT